MACSRKNCDNILCNTYISSIGYICGSCQFEFKEWLKTRDKYPLTEKDINSELEVFMATDAETFKDSPKISVDEFFNRNS